MNDLISRSKAKEEIMAWAIRIMDIKNLSTEDTMIVLDTLPAVDAVEVVRCKDCKYQRKTWHKDRRMKDSGYWIYWCDRNEDPFVSHAVSGRDDEFCSYGERRNGDATD